MSSQDARVSFKAPGKVMRAEEDKDSEYSGEEHMVRRASVTSIAYQTPDLNTHEYFKYSFESRLDFVIDKVKQKP